MIAAYPTPVAHITSQVTHGHVLFKGQIRLDPHGMCAKFDYSQDPNLEPDLGEAGTDTCGGSPTRATVTVRIYRGATRTFSRAVPAKVAGYKSVWSFKAPCAGTRWVVTVVNPWQGTNSSVTGRMRC